MNDWISDLKMHFINGGILVISMTSIDIALKITLLLVSIGYTANRWHLLRKEHKMKINDKNK